MTWFWAHGRLEADLVASGFTPAEAARLVVLKRRYDRGGLQESVGDNRLAFLRWLVEHGRLGQGDGAP